MCTLTWWRDEDGALEVHFNRDELKTRPVAGPPAIYREKGVGFVSPRDPCGGGTWMMANERGVVICLLNRWELEGRRTRHPKSRGRLVWSLVDVETVDDVDEKLAGLEAYQPFILVVFTKEGDRCFEWDGFTLAIDEVPSFLTSSSFCFEEVERARKTMFMNGPRGEEFHASAGEPPSAYSVRMNRPDAQTWSRSQVRVTDRVSWRYLAEQADLLGDPVETRVELMLK